MVNKRNLFWKVQQALVSALYQFLNTAFLGHARLFEFFVFDSKAVYFTFKNRNMHLSNDFNEVRSKLLQSIFKTASEPGLLIPTFRLRRKSS